MTTTTHISDAALKLVIAMFAGELPEPATIADGVIRIDATAELRAHGMLTAGAPSKGADIVWRYYTPRWESYTAWSRDCEMPWSFAGLLHAATQRERVALVLGKLWAQVCNGGFLQWGGNGYAADSRADLARCFEIAIVAKLPLFATVAELVNKAYAQAPWAREQIAPDNPDLADAWRGLDEGDDWEGAYEAAMCATDPLDDAFYKLDEETYFRGVLALIAFIPE